MLKDNYIKLSRNIMNSNYINNAVLLRAYIGLMTCVRFQKTVIDGITVDVNEVLLKKKEIPDIFGSSKRQAYETLRRMEKDGIIEWFNIRNKYTLIRVIKEDFSKDEEPLTFTDHRHTADKRKKKEEEKNYGEINNISEKTDAEQPPVQITAPITHTLSSETSEPATKKTEPEAKKIQTTHHFKPKQRETNYEAYKKRLVALPNTKAPADNCRDSFLSSKQKNTLADILRNNFNPYNTGHNSSLEKTEIITGEPKMRYGEYNNVLLTRDEHNRLIMSISDARNKIDKFSELLRTSPEKRNTNHYAEIMKLQI